MSTTDSTFEPRPSSFSAILRGFGSGILSGALMMGILAGLTLATGNPFMGWGAVALMVSATGLFGGVMATKRVLFDNVPQQDTVPNRGAMMAALLPAISQTVATSKPTFAPAVSAPAPAIPTPGPLAEAAEQPATKSWKEQTGRQDDAQSRIQQILANGSMSDKDRASAILAARESADTIQSRA